MTGLIRNNRGKMPLRGGAAGLVWGRPAPLPFATAALTLAQSMFPRRFADETPRDSHPRLNVGKEIRRIKARSERMLRLLIALWAFICLFVLLAMGLHWKL